VEAGTVFTSKPAGGSADLTFTRSNDTATRVGPNGYIEKVRTNAVLHSEDQSNAAYNVIKQNITSITSESNPLTGTNNAYKVLCNGSDDPYVGQQVYGLSNGQNTFSCWLWTDSGESTEASLFFYNAATTEVFFETLTITTTPTRYSIIADFTSIGALAVCRIDLRNASGSPTYLYTYGWQAEVGDTATDYIPTTTAAVSVGPVANVPRINFDPVLPRTGSLLLEPQRTNTLAYSEYFGAWSLSGGTLTANAEVSPQGVENAYLYTEDTSTNYHRINTGASASSSNKVYSVYAKWAGGTANRWFTIDNGPTAWFDIVNGVVGGAQGSVVTSIEDCGNGWYRCIYHNPTSTTGGIYLGIASSDGGSGNHVGNGQPAFYIYGAQCEDNVTYATSYIPTYGATATRGADTASKTGISSVIGQTEGTLFYDFVWSGAISATADYPIVLSGSDFNNFVGLNTTFNSNQLLAYSGGSIVAAIAGGDFVVGQRYKIALAYKANDFVYYLNGTLQGSDTSGAVPIGLANLEMVTPFGAKSTAQNATSILIFPTRLTNDQLSQITTL